MKASDRVSIEFLRECFEYRDGVLYWKTRPAHHFSRPQDHVTFVKKCAGKPAGRIAGDGYVDIKFRNRGQGVCFGAHRIVWAIHHGKWPDQHIDHINRNPSDNRIENLRDVTPAGKAYAAEAVLAERERCATLCDVEVRRHSAGPENMAALTAEICAAAIRSGEASYTPTLEQGYKSVDINADMRALAAVPALLAAIQEARAALREAVREGLVDENTRRAYESLGEALAKAS